MKNELERVLNFEGNEVKVRTSEGVELFNLANSCRVLGITRKDNSKGTERIRWVGKCSLCEKLQDIVGGENVPPQYIEEINYIIDEIENGDDRNGVYCSRYITSRLAMKCNNDRANKYQNWLAKLDESYSKGEIAMSQSDLSNWVSTTMSNILPTMIESIATQFAPILDETKKQVEEAKKQVESVTNSIGMRNRNTQVIGKRLIMKESEFYGRRIYGTSLEHRLNKSKLYNHFKVVSLDDIPVMKLNDVCEYIDAMKLVDKNIVDNYYNKNANK